MSRIPGKLIAANSVHANQLLDGAEILRTQIKQETAARYQIPITAWRVFDALHTNLPGAGATDDLGLIDGTHGTNSPTLQTEDLKAESGNPTLNKARCLIALPPEYDDGQTVTIRAHAGMKTTVSDGTATIDFSVYESDLEEGVGSDLVTTSATTINSTTLADKDFVVTASGLVSGDVLDILMTTTISDGSTGTAVIAIIGNVELLLDIRA